MGWDKKKLNNKYNFIETPIEGLDYKLAIEEVKKGKYDIFIGDFFVHNQRLSEIDFTIPVMVITPVIIYEPKEKYINRLNYFKYLFKIWIFPVLLILIFSTLIAYLFYILNKKKKKKFITNIYSSLLGFFGETGHLIDTNKLNIFVILSFLCIYYVNVYILASTTAKSVNFLDKTSEMEYNIKNKRILVNKKSISSDLIKRNGGIPVGLSQDIADYNNFIYFNNNKEKLNLDGFLYNSFDDVKKKAKKYNLKVSQIVLGNYRIALMMLKKKQKNII